MMEQDAVHIWFEVDVTAYLLDTNGKKIGVTGLLDTGTVVSVMPVKTWERMGFTRAHSNKPQIGSSQPWSNSRSRKNTDNGTSHGRTGSVDELPVSRKPGRFRPIHIGP